MRDAVRCLAGLAALICGQVQALGLSVSPIGLDLTSKRPIGSVTLSNASEVEKSVQAEVFTWKHVDGVDVLEPTEDLAVSPPIFRLAAGQRQVVRVGAVGKTSASTQEISYRLVLSELPEPDEGAGQLKMLLRLSLPVFMAANGKPQESVDWQFRSNAAGEIEVRLRNTGNQRAHFGEVSLRPFSGAGTELKLPAPAYLLVGEDRTLIVRPPERWQGMLRLTAKTDSGSHEFSLPLLAP